MTLMTGLLWLMVAAKWPLEDVPVPASPAAQEEAFQAIVGQLKDPDPTKRREAVHALITLSDPRALPLIKEALKDPEPSVQEMARVILMLMVVLEAPGVHDPSTPPTLPVVEEVFQTFVKQLEDPDPAKRLAAVNALGGLQDPRAIPLLQHALKDPDPTVKEAAMIMLYVFPQAEAARVLREALSTQDQPAFRQLAVHGLKGRKDFQTVAAIKRALTDADPSVRQAAVVAVPEDDPDRLDLLSRAVKEDADFSVRRAAADLLIETVPAESGRVPPIIHTLFLDKNLEVRRLLATVAAEHPKQALVPILIERLTKDPDDKVKQQVARALGATPDPKSVPALIAAFNEAPMVSTAAVNALGQLTYAKAVTVLRETLKHHQDPILRHAVVLAMANPDRPEWIPDLKEALGDPAPAVRLAVLWVLNEKFKDPDAKDLFEEAFQQQADPKVQAQIQAAIISVVNLPASSASLPALTAALEDPRSAVRLAALGILAYVKDPQVTAILGHALTHQPGSAVRREVVTALGIRSELQAAPLLKSALADKNLWVRLAAVRALGARRDAPSRAALKQAVKHADPQVRTAAREALSSTPRLAH